MWFSIIARPTTSSFSRTERLTCAYVLLCGTMLMNIMYYEQDQTTTSSSALVVGPLVLTQSQIVIGILSNLLIFPPSFLLLQIFRKSRECKTRSMQIRNKVSDMINNRLNINQLENPERKTKRENEIKCKGPKKIKIKKRFTLPWWFRCIGYLLAVFMIQVSLVFIIIKGVTFGDDKCRKWLTSFLVSILTSVFITANSSGNSGIFVCIPFSQGRH